MIHFLYATILHETKISDKVTKVTNIHPTASEKSVSRVMHHGSEWPYAPTQVIQTPILHQEPRVNLHSFARLCQKNQKYTIYPSRAPSRAPSKPKILQSITVVTLAQHFKIMISHPADRLLLDAIPSIPYARAISETRDPTAASWPLSIAWWVIAGRWLLRMHSYIELD